MYAKKEIYRYIDTLDLLEGTSMASNYWHIFVCQNTPV